MLFSCFICGLDAMKDVHVLLSHLGGICFLLLLNVHSFL
jgi:hypothetical protein